LRHGVDVASARCGACVKSLTFNGTHSAYCLLIEGKAKAVCVATYILTPLANQHHSTNQGQQRSTILRTMPVTAKNLAI